MTFAKRSNRLSFHWRHQALTVCSLSSLVKYCDRNNIGGGLIVIRFFNLQFKTEQEAMLAKKDVCSQRTATKCFFSCKSVPVPFQRVSNVIQLRYSH